MEFALCFSASGYIYQNIEIIDENETPQNIIKKLNSGEYMTTIHETDKTIQETATGKKIAYITDTNNELEYVDFEINED